MQRRAVRLTMFVLALALLTGCSERWEGSVYPDRGNLTRPVNVGEYPSLEQCRLAARQVLTNRFNDPRLERGDYECGKNCDDGSRYGGVKVCKETAR
jgi:hypothetical protein